MRKFLGLAPVEFGGVCGILEAVEGGNGNRFYAVNV